MMIRTSDLAARRDPCMKVRLAKGTSIRHFEIRPVPMAHAWHSWVERDDGPRHAVYFNWQEALQARSAYEQEIASCLDQGWQPVTGD
jgi:hypothetical protein